MNYFVFRPSFDEQFCVIDDDPEAVLGWELSEGEELDASGWADVVLPMSPEFAGIKTSDVLANTHRVLMVSERLKIVLDEAGGASVQFLPFQLRNHKGRVVPERFFVANVLGAIDCVDLAKTVGDPDPLNPGRLCEIEKIAFDPGRVPSDRHLFRVTTRPQIVVVSEELKRRIEALGATGAQFLASGEERPPLSLRL